MILQLMEIILQMPLLWLRKRAGQYLFTSLRDGEKVPASTPISEVKMEEEAALVNLICVNLDEYAKTYQMQP